MDTIFALASGAGRAAIAVVRVSGPSSCLLVEALCGRLPEPRRATLCTLRSPEDGEPLDRALVLWLPGPTTFTGEDCAEFHVHGGRAVIADVLRAFGMVLGCRPAEPGEFTRRAYLNGRMDLTGVEALADLIDAETRAQRRQALRHLDGPLGAQAERWRASVLDASALIEAQIDFADEADVGDIGLDAIRDILQPVATEIFALVRDEGDRGVRMREGFTVIVAGPPNAGKSTLMNALVRRDVAIVSPIAGTTRDLIEAHLDLDGLPVVLVDTAGIRDGGDPLEQEGMARARRRAEQGDLVLWLETAASDPSSAIVPAFGPPVLHVATQVDRVEAINVPRRELAISALTGEGVPKLLEQIRTIASDALVGAETSLMTRTRHRVSLTAAATALSNACAALDNAMHLELVAEDVRVAATQLGRIAGRIDVEDILSEIFGRFCIGK